jgi:hypothetical protein
MNEKLVLAASAVLNVLALYGVWLMMPEEFLLVLTGYLKILIFGVVPALAGSQENEVRRETRRAGGEMPALRIAKLV